MKFLFGIIIKLFFLYSLYSDILSYRFIHKNYILFKSSYWKNTKIKKWNLIKLYLFFKYSIILTLIVNKII